MKEDYIIWTIAPKEGARAAAGELAASMEKVGLFKELHVWARGPVAGAITQNLEEYDPAGGWYRLNFLNRVAKETKAKYLLWLDPVTGMERLSVSGTCALDESRGHPKPGELCGERQLLRHPPRSHRESDRTGFDFARRADAEGWRLPVEPLLAYAMQMLCADPERHLGRQLVNA